MEPHTPESGVWGSINNVFIFNFSYCCIVQLYGTPLQVMKAFQEMFEEIYGTARALQSFKHDIGRYGTSHVAPNVWTSSSDRMNRN